MKKKIMSLLLAVVMCLSPMSVALAGEAGTAGNGWDIEIGQTGTGALGDMGGTVSTVLGIVQTIGYVVAIVMVMYVGIRYLTAGASKKAEVKETLIPILVGAILIVAAVTIVNWLFGIAA